MWKANFFSIHSMGYQFMPIIWLGLTLTTHIKLFIAYLHQLGHVKKEKKTIVKNWDDPPTKCENSYLWFVFFEWTFPLVKSNFFNITSRKKSSFPINCSFPPTRVICWKYFCLYFNGLINPVLIPSAIRSNVSPSSKLISSRSWPLYSQSAFTWGNFLTALGLGLGLPPPGTGRGESVTAMDFLMDCDTPPSGTFNTDMSTGPTCFWNCRLVLNKIFISTFWTEFFLILLRFTAGLFWGCWLGAGPIGGPGFLGPLLLDWVEVLWLLGADLTLLLLWFLFFLLFWLDLFTVGPGEEQKVKTLHEKKNIYW